MSTPSFDVEPDCRCGGRDTSSGYGGDGCRAAGPVAATRRVTRVLLHQDMPALVSFIGSPSPVLAAVRGARPPMRELLRSGPPHRLRQLAPGSPQLVFMAPGTTTVKE